jgi:D-tyrosyl-tRNA(Tyr) deacylase
MRAIVQRVTDACVFIKDRNIKRNIGKGIVILLGISKDDTEEQSAYLANKIANLRIFEGSDGKMDKSLLDIDGEALVISQFTLYGDCRKGRRPDFTKASDPETANKLYVKFVEYLRKEKIKTTTGEFGAKMLVDIHNDGPVTLILER